MSERDLRVIEVKKESKENDRQITLTQTNAGISEAYVLSYQKQSLQLKKVHELRVKELNDKLKRQIDNTKRHHAMLDSLIENKEKLHLKLKEAYHFGEVQCEHCNRYFSPQGISRHRTSCASKPENKIEKEHEEEVNEIKDDIEAKKKQLREQLKSLEKLGVEKLGTEKL